MKVKRLSRPYRYRIEDVAGEPLRCVRAGWEMTFSEFDFARGIAMVRSTEDRPLVVRDLETGKVMDVEGNLVLL